jgi:hypothetical protein
MILNVILFALCAFRCAVPQNAPDPRWAIHDPNRPSPPVVIPTPARPPAPPPSDAVVLFGGPDLSAWVDEKGNAPKWRVEREFIEVVPKSGSIRTRESFGDCQLHIEWASPEAVRNSGQERGNSGIFLMGRYEIQILDCHNNETYADGTAAAVYGQYPPLVNACRKPGEWQTFEIFFHAPRFDDSGKLTAAARVTVVHNGVLVQDNVVLSGPTGHKVRPSYTPHPERLPLMLQDHGNPVRFRNIWIRDIRSHY